MWFFAPMRWYEVPGWLFRAWTARVPTTATRPTEAPSRPVTTQPRGTPRPGRLPLGPTIEKIRRQVEKVRPEDCCVKQPMIAGGKRSMVCSNDCPWQELDLLVATASIDAE